MMLGNGCQRLLGVRVGLLLDLRKGGAERGGPAPGGGGRLGDAQHARGGLRLAGGSALHLWVEHAAGLCGREGPAAGCLCLWCAMRGLCMARAGLKRC